jgi:hypothetical protein
MRPIVGFTGVGFTPQNMSSFETLDSDFKADLGCRGVGRLLWLKAFDRVSVRSAYEDEAGDLRGREFRFSVEHDGRAEGFARPGAVVTFAAISLSEAGADLLAVSRAIGHARPSITLDRYGHLAPAGLAPPMARIDDVVGPLRKAA